MTAVPVLDDAAIRTCADLASQIWTEFYTPIIGAAQVRYMLDTIQSAEAISRQIREEGYHYYLLIEQERLLGYYATVVTEDALKLSKLYVLKEHRGSGAGAFALQLCRREASSLGLKRLELTVNRHNPSVGFYEKMGFENAGPLVQEIGGGFVMDDYVMVMPL